MELENLNSPQAISLRPAAIFALIKVFPLIILTLGFLFLAWWIFPAFIWLSLITLGMTLYRLTYIRKINYLVTPEFVRISRGIFFRRTDQVELFRVKDYILTQSFLLQVFRLMDLELTSTDPVNPVIWLRGIPHSNLIDTIREHVQETRQHNRIYEIN
ncbi:PH domain-containing protein [Mucilaginibacter gotjawali]|uniref:Membrane protein YdbT with pleckstrin-like domain n=2 Tax=Mucilaginibacter gotjawali TaxID=1550579 RepID=A0A839SMF3_9SPHI|nr:PH domain-containing protein [Mucilaginibacter gotjawali]MBB3058752.1 putative membrane protein YdbT with pleckstrin-like domain [Mucilaginibacter gotjawali]BAU55645.1 Bacterial membrane flanked domain protein [Mucilaginibacter gotjawali]